jgi:hypothetical protein
VVFGQEGRESASSGSMYPSKRDKPFTALLDLQISTQSRAQIDFTPKNQLSLTRRFVPPSLSQHLIAVCLSLLLPGNQIHV